MGNRKYQPEDISIDSKHSSTVTTIFTIIIITTNHHHHHFRCRRRRYDRYHYYHKVFKSQSPGLHWNFFAILHWFVITQARFCEHGVTLIYVGSTLRAGTSGGTRMNPSIVFPYLRILMVSSILPPFETHYSNDRVHRPLSFFLSCVVHIRIYNITIKLLK